MSAKVLIVDDEPHARRYLRDLLIKDSEIEVIGECKNGREALSFLKNITPDIIFLDIQMPGITGMEVASELKSGNALVIFTTAYDQYALKAFEAEALDYLLKPFDEQRFFEVLNRAKDILERDQQAQFSEKMMNIYNDYRQSLSPHLVEFIIKQKGLELAIKVNDVVTIESSSVYVILHTMAESSLYRTAMHLLEQQLPPNFVRIHRAYIINTDHVLESKYLNNNTFSFEMSNGKNVVSSRAYKLAITNFINDA